MQPAITNSKPAATTNAAGDLQLEFGDEDSPDSADKPASNISSAHRSSSLASTQTITPATANHCSTTTTTIANTMAATTTSPFVPVPVPKTANGAVKRMFRSGDSTPRAGLVATPNGNGIAVPYVAGAAPAVSGATMTAFSGSTPISIDKNPPYQHLPRGAYPSMSSGTESTMHGSAGSFNSTSPSSTLPPTSEPPSPPVSLPPSRPGSRKSSFSERGANKTPSEADGGHHGGQRFTLKDLLATGPKVARKPSQSSRKSDTSSDRGGYAESTTTSLLKKYGVCEKIAIGKGATSVVRLAHKWDRSQEKLYAVKVCLPPFFFLLPLFLGCRRGVIALCHPTYREQLACV